MYYFPVFGEPRFVEEPAFSVEKKSTFQKLYLNLVQITRKRAFCYCNTVSCQTASRNAASGGL
jgi:hypothetical protein